MSSAEKGKKKGRTKDALQLTFALVERAGVASFGLLIRFFFLALRLGQPIREIISTVDGRDTGQNAITSNTCGADTSKIDISRTRRRSPNLALCFSTGN